MIIKPHPTLFLFCFNSNGKADKFLKWNQSDCREERYCFALKFLWGNVAHKKMSAQFSKVFFHLAVLAGIQLTLVQL